LTNKSAQKAIAEVMQAFGGVDILVNNGGGGSLSWFDGSIFNLSFFVTYLNSPSFVSFSLHCRPASTTA
jgi:NAD(P)-dependent dehydrogenase (short-subunit alcohol dehydrogenase family)